MTDYLDSLRCRGWELSVLPSSVNVIVPFQSQFNCKLSNNEEISLRRREVRKRRRHRCDSQHPVVFSGGFHEGREPVDTDGLQSFPGHDGRRL